jgi:hypothetical protein
MYYLLLLFINTFIVIIIIYHLTFIFPCSIFPCLLKNCHILIHFYCTLSIHVCQFCLFIKSEPGFTLFIRRISLKCDNHFKLPYLISTLPPVLLSTTFMYRIVDMMIEMIVIIIIITILFKFLGVYVPEGIEIKNDFKILKCLAV